MYHAVLLVVLTIDLMYLVMDLCSWPTLVQKNIRSTRPTMIKRNPLGRVRDFKISIMPSCPSGQVDLFAVHYYAYSPITIAGKFCLALFTGHCEHQLAKQNVLGTRLASITLKFLQSFQGSLRARLDTRLACDWVDLHVFKLHPPDLPKGLKRQSSQKGFFRVRLEQDDVDECQQCVENDEQKVQYFKPTTEKYSPRNTY